MDRCGQTAADVPQVRQAPWAARSATRASPSVVVALDLSGSLRRRRLASLMCGSLCVAHVSITVSIGVSFAVALDTLGAEQDSSGHAAEVGRDGQLLSSEELAVEGDTPGVLTRGLASHQGRNFAGFAARKEAGLECV